MTRPSFAIDATSALLLGALSLVWGGSFFLAEIALRELGPLTVTLHRVLWAVPVLWLVLQATGVPLPRDLRTWGAFAVMGTLNNALPFTLIFWGQTRIDSGLAAILNGTTAMWGALAAGLLLRDEPLGAGRIAGAALGVAGVAIIFDPGALGSFDAADLGQVAVLAAALSYALASVWARRVLAHLPPLANAFGMLACSSVMMLPLATWIEGPPRLSLSLSVWAALATLSVLSTALAYLLYFRILARAGAANLMLVTLLIPPIAILLGAVALGESLEARAFAGFAVIALGLVVTDGRVFRRKRLMP